MTASTSPSTVIQSTRFCNLAPPSAIDISTNFLVGNAAGAQVGISKLASVPVTGGFGDLMQYYEGSSDAYSETQQDTSLNYIRVALTDAATGELLDLQGTPWSVALLIKEVPPGEQQPTYQGTTRDFFVRPGASEGWQSLQREDSTDVLSVKDSVERGRSSPKGRAARSRSPTRSTRQE
jgi:hypothetical protein